MAKFFGLTNQLVEVANLLLPTLQVYNDFEKNRCNSGFQLPRTVCRSASAKSSLHLVSSTGCSSDSVQPVVKQLCHCLPFTILEHVEPKLFGRINSDKLYVSGSKAQLITRCKAFHFIKPKAREKVGHGGVRPNYERALRNMTW